jgi:hypothetical protein
VRRLEGAVLYSEGCSSTPLLLFYLIAFCLFIHNLHVLTQKIPAQRDVTYHTKIYPTAAAA